MTERPLVIDGMRGLGDNVFQRPFVKAAAARRPTWLRTPWPQLWADVPGLKLLPSQTRLRTQELNELAQPARTWAEPPPAGAETVRLVYGHDALRRGSIPQALERLLPLGRTPFVFDLPDPGPAPITAGRPIAVIRPATVRAEWRNEARNPRPAYLAEIAQALMATHFVVVVAHLAAGAEWLDGDLPPHHLALTRGELGVMELLALVKAADLVVGGVGWLVPASIALGTAGFFVLGGQLGHNGPDKITDPRMDLTRTGWARPTPGCACENMRHACRKDIPDLMAQFQAWRWTLSLGTPPA